MECYAGGIFPSPEPNSVFPQRSLRVCGKNITDARLKIWRKTHGESSKSHFWKKCVQIYLHKSSSKCFLIHRPRHSHGSRLTACVCVLGHDQIAFHTNMQRSGVTSTPKPSPRVCERKLLQTANYFVFSHKRFSPGCCSRIGNRRRFHGVNCGMSDCSGKH